MQVRTVGRLRTISLDVDSLRVEGRESREASPSLTKNRKLRRGFERMSKRGGWNLNALEAVGQLAWKP
ncbi:hypothetical protein BV25DRAFT_1820001 [Artomyces pyxidatus]|uniref:Uncharacterized protein n=1 Tax=Artomyces pyxidatus TaxID=48021 RepID=A0ACB8TEL0_9AGAM|nr:hypothetical protein BV25DRAFT_1820001 [Artomyces pyxidatus]